VFITVKVTRTSFPLVETTIDALQSAVRSGKISCRDIVRSHLRRIGIYDQSTGLNAIIFPNPDAMAIAEKIDNKIAAGIRPGSLFGVPVLLKDNFDTADMPTSGGSVAMKDSIPPDDAFTVRRLREADAIIIAKTNMAEWAFSPKQTVSSSYGTTANAYDLNRVPAGSSGGTASGIAASFGVIGMGSDTGNSVRGPASHLALFGLRPTLGLVSRDGLIPLAVDRDIPGVMTRTVADGARVLSTIAGYDAADPYTERAKNQPAENYDNYLHKSALQGRRIGVLRALVDTEEADTEIKALFEQALVAMQTAGAEIIDDFQIDKLTEHFARDTFCRRFRFDMSRYLASLGERAPIRDVAEVLETKQYSPHVEKYLKAFATNPPDRQPKDFDPPCPDFMQHPQRQAFLQDVVESMDRARVDVVVFPSWTNPPAHLNKADEEYRGDNSQLIAPPTGLPAATVPMGFSRKILPAGLQILGRPFAEGTIIGIAYAYEQATQHRRPPENYPEIDGS